MSHSFAIPNDEFVSFLILLHTKLLSSTNQCCPVSLVLLHHTVFHSKIMLAMNHSFAIPNDHFKWVWLTQSQDKDSVRRYWTDAEATTQTPQYGESDHTCDVSGKTFIRRIDRIPLLASFSIRFHKQDRFACIVFNTVRRVPCILFNKVSRLFTSGRNKEMDSLGSYMAQMY